MCGACAARSLLKEVKREPDPGGLVSFLPENKRVLPGLTG